MGDLLDMAAKENVPQACPLAADKQVIAPPTPLKSLTASCSNAVLRSHQQKSRLAFHMVHRSGYQYQFRPFTRTARFNG